MMKFEFDPKKSDSNKLKHGIDFKEAIHLWSDPELIELKAKDVDETRYMIIAIYKQKHWAAIFTKREDLIRLISVRRARKKEIEFYESY